MSLLLKKHLERTIDELLTARGGEFGLVRTRRNYFRYPLAPLIVDAHIGLVIARAVSPTSLVVNPVVLVEPNEIRHWLVTNTIGSNRLVGLGDNVGYLSKERDYRQWEFDLEADPIPVVNDLTATLREVALPYFESLGSLSDIENAIAQGRSTRSPEYLRPLLRKLLGDSGGAMQKAQEYLQKMDDRWPETEEYKSFISALSDH